MSAVDSGLFYEAPGIGKVQKEKKVVESLSNKEGPKRKDQVNAEVPSCSGELPSSPAATQRAVPTTEAEKEEVKEEDLETGASNQQRSRFCELPLDLADLLADKVFQDEDDLDATLLELKIADEPICLDDEGKACYYMPGEEYSSARGQIAQNFSDWANKLKGVARENTNIHLGPRLAGAPPPRKRRRPKKRLPDVSIWGRSKCALREDGRVLCPLSASTSSTQPKVHPHVVIQISVFNDEDYEIDAINDLATRAIAGQGPQPGLSILIKERRADPAQGVQAGFDIYRLPNGTYFEDAVNGSNGASHSVYNHGGPDVFVTITEADLGGINLSLWQTFKDYLQGGSRNFEISMAELYQVMF